MAERHLHPVRSGRSGKYESIVLFRGDGAGEAQQPAKQLIQHLHSTLSCLASPLGTHLKFWHNIRGKLQGLDERAVRMCP